MFPKIVGFPPKSSILIGFSIINHPFWVGFPLFLETPEVTGILIIGHFTDPVLNQSVFHGSCQPAGFC